MWVIVWICSSINKKVSVEPLLNFCRPTDPLSHWKECSILHYSLVKGCKGPEYVLKSTFVEGADLNCQSLGINNDVCARKYVDYLEQLILLRRQLYQHCRHQSKHIEWLGQCTLK